MRICIPETCLPYDEWSSEIHARRFRDFRLPFLRKVQTAVRPKSLLSHTSEIISYFPKCVPNRCINRSFPPLYFIDKFVLKTSPPPLAPHQDHHTPHYDSINNTPPRYRYPNLQRRQILSRLMGYLFSPSAKFTWIRGRPLDNQNYPDLHRSNPHYRIRTPSLHRGRN